MGVDMSIGAIYKNAFVRYEESSASGQTEIEEHFITKGWAPHMRINLYFYLFGVK